MPTRFRLIVLGAAALIFLTLLFVVLTSESQSKPQRLSDGSFVRIVSVDYGHSHNYRLPPPKRWRQFLARHLPAALNERLPWWDTGGGVGSTARPGESNLAIVTFREQRDFVVFWSTLRLEVWDDQGHLLDTPRGAATSGNFGKTRRRELVCWVSSQIPSNSPTIVIRISAISTNSGDSPVVAEFRMPNPVGRSNTDATRVQTLKRSER